MAVRSSWRKLLISAWVNTRGPWAKSLLTVICMTLVPLAHPLFWPFEEGVVGVGFAQVMN
jgi:hypothetical protein